MTQVREVAPGVFEIKKGNIIEIAYGSDALLRIVRKMNLK